MAPFTPEDRKRIKYGKYTAKQVRTEPADLANTVLKMACKRAQLAMTLNVTAASDIFSQDLDDLPPELLPEVEPPKPAPVITDTEAALRARIAELESRQIGRAHV